MRILLTVSLLLWALIAAANTRQWKDAKVIKISSDSDTVAAVPVGGALIAGRIFKTYYWIEAEDTTYVLGPAIGKRQSLDVTLYGKTKIAIEGRNAHILDDEGKDRKIPIAEKIARTVAPN